MYVLVLALRYLRRRRITFLGVTAVALGVFAFIVVVGVMEGFRQELRRRLRGALGDLVVVGGLQDPRFRERVTDRLQREPQVKALAPRLEGVGILRMRGRATSADFQVPPGEDLRGEGASATGQGDEAEHAAPIWRRAPGAPEPGVLTAFKRVEVAGIVPEQEAQVTDFPRYLLDVTVAKLAAWDEAKEGGPWLVAGEELVARPKVAVGAEVRLLVPRGVGEYDSLPFRLAGTFRTGIYEYDSEFVYIPLASAQKMRKAPGAVSRLVLKLEDALSPEAAAPKLQKAVVRLTVEFYGPSPAGVWLHDPARGASPEGGEEAGASAPRVPASPMRAPQSARDPTGPESAPAESTGPEPAESEPGVSPPLVLTSDEMNSILLAAVRSQAKMASLVLVFYFLVAGVAVFAIMTMVVVEKTRDLGVIRAVGGSVRGVLATFLLYGLAIGVAGVCIGVVAGRLTLSHLDWLRHQISVRTGWEPFPKELYMLDRLPWTFEPGLVLAVVAVALVTVLISSLYPAWRGARLQPVETLRYE
jgi:ABC-type lipoprotein release transport system permease subunit